MRMRLGHLRSRTSSRLTRKTCLISLMNTSTEIAVQLIPLLILTMRKSKYLLRGNHQEVHNKQRKRKEGISHSQFMMNLDSQRPSITHFLKTRLKLLSARIRAKRLQSKQSLLIPTILRVRFYFSSTLFIGVQWDLYHMACLALL